MKRRQALCVVGLVVSAMLIPAQLAGVVSAKDETVTLTITGMT